MTRILNCCLTAAIGIAALPVVTSEVARAGDAPVTPTHKISLPQAHKGTLEIDTLLLDSFGPPAAARRAFYLKAREILVASVNGAPSDPGIVAAAKTAGLGLISGPMLGDVTHSAITVWFRPVTSGAVTVLVAHGKDDRPKTFVAERGEAGRAARVRLEGLLSSTRYSYSIMDEDRRILGDGSFITAPAPGSKEKMRIAFGSCFHKIGVHDPNLMRLIKRRGNRAMLLLGDLAVDDREAKTNMHHADYILRDVSEAWREFVTNIPVYASWDDHDYLNNDKSGLHRGRITDAQRNSLRRLWQESWVNPETAVENRGIYFNAVIGDVEVIMLDTRSCRAGPKRTQLNSYLGEEQMLWLQRTLTASRARFIILTSGTMWSDYVSKGKDSWGSWDMPGREQIYNFIEENRIGGVLLLSGDRHGARGFRIPRPSGFAFHEFEAATLGGVRGPGAYANDRSSQLFGYGRLKAFGEFTFDMAEADPKVTFRLIDEAERELEMHQFRLSALTPGK